MKDEEYAFTRGMERAEIESRLRATPTGVLAVANEGEAYAFPVAHSYDDGRLYLRLGLTTSSEKRRFLASPGHATYVVYDTMSTDGARSLESWSVIATGTLRALDEDEQFEPEEINRRFPPIRLFGEDVAETEIRIYHFDVDSLAGRMTPAFDDAVGESS